MLRIALTTALFDTVRAACNWTAADDVDYDGGDLPSQPISKTVSFPIECATLCCADPNCGAFSLNAGGPNSRWCYLKGLSGYSIDAVPGVNSGCLRGDCATPPPPPDAYFPWFNLSIPRAERLALLVSNMTDDEAIAWLNDGVPAMPRLGLPAYSWEAEALHGVSWNGVATAFPSNIAWGAAFDTGLIREIGRIISLEMRAKWVAGLNKGGSAEFAGLSFMTPNNNLFVNPAWGRGQETYGESPFLTSAITYELIKALQFDDGTSTYTRAIATTKHFLGYHLESYDGDGQYRLSHSYNYTEADIQQVYFPPFAAAIRAGVTAMMCAYDGQNGTNPAWPYPGGKEPWGVPLCLHPDMQRLMRDPALGWKGYVISDEGAISFAGPGYHSYTSTLIDAACLAFNAGTDLALGGEYASTLATCLARGNTTQARLREALTRVLSAQFDLGWFDTLAALRGGFPDPVPFNAVSDENVTTPAARALARQVARDSLVLLKNSGGTALPLRAIALKAVALVGPAASFSGTSTGQYLGNYAACTDGPGGDVPKDPRCHVVTLHEALTNRSAAGGWELRYAPGCDVNTVGDTKGFPAALAAAAGADVIVAAMGIDTCQESLCSEGEANDRVVAGGRFPAAGLDLGGAQLALLQALRAAHPATPLIVVLFNGGPISSPWTMENAEAVLEAWYPGLEGGAAVAEALFGDASPAGRMPVTTVRSVADLPPHTDVVMATPPGRTHMYFSGVPLIPFGFGLSYANFSYAGLQVAPAALGPSDAAFTVSATLTHAGGAASDEVVQLYGRFDAPSVGLASVPLLQLLGFTRVRGVAPGSQQPVSFTISREALALMDPVGVMRVQAGTWSLWLGGGPPSAPSFGGGAVLQGEITVE